MNSNNRMRKIGETSYQQNGIIIDFECLGKDKYSFKVRGDKQTTRKLLLSVKRTRVSERYFWPCAKAIFTIIEKGEYPELIPEERLGDMIEDFFLEFNEDPKFKIKNISKANDPLHIAEIEYTRLDIFFHPKQGKGRTVNEAKARCLESFFKELKKRRVDS